MQNFDLLLRGGSLVFPDRGECVPRDLAVRDGRILFPEAGQVQATRVLDASGLLVVMGFVVNRLNVSLTGFEAAQGRTYVPAMSELVVTLMLVAVSFFAFGQAVKWLPVYPEEEAGHGQKERPAPVLLAKAS